MQVLLRLLSSGALNYVNPLYWLAVALRAGKVTGFILPHMQEDYGDALILPSVGSEKSALSLASRATKKIPAYRQLVPAPAAEWQQYPITDKASYIRANHISALLADNYLDTFSIFRSSGSSGKATYWPQLKSDHRLSSRAIQVYLESCFQIHRHKTLIIIGLSLGSWIGGDHLSTLLKQCSLQVPYPFTVFAPGNRYDEILEIITEAQNFVDQIILVVCPSAIGHLSLLAESRSMPLPSDKMRFLVLGEAFPESFRIALQGKAKQPVSHPVMFSMYGSADTGALGVESKASIALRQLLFHTPALREKLGMTGDIPHFFHASAPDAFLETVNNELCITRWQGVPIVRYNLHDHAALYNWKSLRTAVLQVESQHDELRQIISASSEHLPPVIAIYGRADRCLILCGTNISEGMLNAAVKSAALHPLLTGLYQASILYDADRQYLALDLELRQGISPTPAIDAEVYHYLVAELSKVQPEFEEDWKHIYASWDNEPDKRILRIRYHTWPELSKTIESGIKHVGIRP